MQTTEAEPQPRAPRHPAGPWRVLLFNDQVHSFDEVIALLAVATGLDLDRCIEITELVHTAGRAEVIRTTQEGAERILTVLHRGDLLAAMRRA